MSFLKTKYQKFEIRLVARSTIHEAPYNPRILGEEPGKRLREKIKSVGLLSPLVWNERTGNLVSGHQRLKQLDKLEGYPKKAADYHLQVSAVDLDDKTEKEMVVFLNNPSAQGDWDLDLLTDLKLKDDIGFEQMGFSEADIDMMFEGDGRFSALFQDDSAVKEAKGTLKKIKEDRAKAVENLKSEDSADFYVMIVCETPEEKARLCQIIGVPPSENFINANVIERLAEKVKKQ